MSIFALRILEKWFTGGEVDGAERAFCFQLFLFVCTDWYLGKYQKSPGL